MLGIGGGSGGYGWAGMAFGIIIWALIIAGIVWLVIWLTKTYSAQGSQQKGSRQSNETPMEILKRRYAEGEVTKKEFEEMKKELRHK